MLRTAFVSTYPPRHCGVATYTHALSGVMGGREVVALHPRGAHAAYPPEVHHRIRRDERGDYARTAHDVSHCVDVVSVQHDFAIWGADDGAAVIDFVRELSVPAVVTLHTVPRHPTPGERAAIVGLAGAAAGIVVMSRAAARTLVAVYGVPAQDVTVIAHGVPNLPLVEADTIKPTLDLAGRDVILGPGLLAPERGHETILEALPAIIAARPTALYVVLGATHPDSIALDGESYRRALEARVAALGLGRHVRFVDRFVGRVELTRWLEAADVVVTPHRDLDRGVSGSLASAMGAGRPVVSTPSDHAAELLADDRGVLVAPGAPGPWAAILVALLGDAERRAAIGRRAHAHTRPMIWSQIGGEYRDLLARAAAAGRPAAPPTPPTPRARWSAATSVPVRALAATDPGLHQGTGKEWRHGDLGRAGVARGRDGM